MPIILDPNLTYRVDGETEVFEGKDLISKAKGNVKMFYYLISGSRDNEGHSLGASVLLRSKVNVFDDLSAEQFVEFLDSLLIEVVEALDDPELVGDELTIRSHHFIEDSKENIIRCIINYTYYSDEGNVTIKLIEGIEENFVFESESTTLVLDFPYTYTFSSTY